MKKELISGTELEFMNYIWSSSNDLNLQDFMNYFKDRDWERETYSSYLHKLSKKNFLEKYRVGRTFYYRPIISQLEYQQMKINQLLNNKFGMPLEGLIATFCGKKCIKVDTLNEIRGWLKELEEDE